MGCSRRDSVNPWRQGRIHRSKRLLQHYGHAKVRDDDNKAKWISMVFGKRRFRRGAILPPEDMQNSILFRIAATILIAAPVLAQVFNPVPPSFFCVISTDVNDYPNVSFGAVDVRQTWPEIETSKGVYDFSFIDHYVNDAKRHGLLDASTNTVDALLTFGLTPEWYAADPKSCSKPYGTVVCSSPPANVQDWVNFVTAVMNHYNGGTQPHIRYYELWNEANLLVFWSGTSADLVNLAKAAYPIVHADPYSMLLTPSVSGSVGPPSGPAAATWMAGYLDAGGSQYADGGSFHGYIGKPGITPYPMPEQDSTAACAGSTATDCYGSIVTEIGRAH